MAGFLVTGCAQNKKTELDSENVQTIASEGEIVSVTPEELNQAGTEIVLVDVSLVISPLHSVHAQLINSDR